MGKGETSKKVGEIVERIIGKDIEKMNYSENLFSNKIGIKPYELVYIFFELEKSFNINFLPQDIIDEGFTTISKISELIDKKLGEITEDKNE